MRLRDWVGIEGAGRCGRRNCASSAVWGSNCCPHLTSVRGTLPPCVFTLHFWDLIFMCICLFVSTSSNSLQPQLGAPLIQFNSDINWSLHHRFKDSSQKTAPCSRYQLQVVGPLVAYSFCSTWLLLI